MKVFLISPPRLPDFKKCTGSIPTSLLYLASALRDKGHFPNVFDLSIISKLTTDCREELPESLKESIELFQPGLIGINCFTTLHFPYIRHLSRSLRKKYFDIPIVIGGAHPSLFPEAILENCPCIDYVVVGEGEEQITQLADALSVDHSHVNLTHIQSFAWRKDRQIVYQARKNYISDIDTISDPAWDLISIDNYNSDTSKWNNPKKLSFKCSAPILSSRSCPFNCNFCAAHATMGRQFRMRSPLRIVDEIQMLYEQYDLNYFAFLDDNMSLNKNHILDICSEICKRNLNIEFETLSGLHMNSLDKEVIDALEKAGCVFVRLAIEHGNDQIRNQVIGKKLNRDKIYEVCTEFKSKFSVRTAGMFIMGFPQDTCDSLDDTHKMILDLRLDLNYVFNLIPLPGTQVFKQAQKDGILLHNYNIDQLWTGESSFDVTQGESPFYLIPYAMTLDQLQHYRKIFDTLRIPSASKTV